MISQIKSRLLTGVVTIKALVSLGAIMLSMASIVPVAQAASAAAISSGTNFNCAVSTVGGVQCWGYNAQGQLGNGVAGNSKQPVDVVGLSSGVVDVATSSYFACALLSNGTVKCWGSNNLGQLGNGTTSTTPSSTPVNVAGLTGAVSIAVGGNTACAATAAGELKCWGGNSSSIFNGTPTASYPFPTAITSLTGVIKAAIGGNHICALINTGEVKCWGANSYGALGIGNTASSGLNRISATGINDAVAITAGPAHTCVRTAAGAAKCWGGNAQGQIGNATNGTASVLAPVTVTGLDTDVIAISSGAGANHACAVLGSGGVKCWGQNTAAQLGLGTGDKTNKPAPVSVAGLSGAARLVSASYNNTCAVVGFNIQCWGDNTYGQLGDGTNLAYPYPVSVLGYAGAPPSVAPATISPVTSNTPVYTWKPILGASNYRLNVNGVISTYTAAQAGCDGGFGLCTVTSAALAAGSYTWYVQGYNTFGAGPWSAATNFRL